MNTYLKTFISSILAGICISIGGIAFLSCESKVTGAIFFVVGLFVICTFGLHLFTGKLCYLPDQENKLKYAATLAVIWVGNFAGCFLTAAAVKAARISGPLMEKAAGMCETKLSDSYLSLFILGILCNILIYIAVEGYRSNPHELGKYASIFFGVTIFIICGFEHCVADMFYFSLAAGINGQVLAAELVITAGNFAGGLLLPLCRKVIS